MKLLNFHVHIKYILVYIGLRTVEVVVLPGWLRKQGHCLGGKESSMVSRWQVWCLGGMDSTLVVERMRRLLCCLGG